MATMIQIRCGLDKVFYISETNLRKSKFFDTLLSDRWKKENTENTVEVDEDPKLFRHFLNSLRHPTYKIPDRYAENVLILFGFYQVGYTQISIPPDELWVIKTKRFHETFKFTGKFVTITFYLRGTRHVQIKFNNVEIFNDKVFGYMKEYNYSPKETDGFWILNKHMFKYFEELEGEFEILIEYVNTPTKELYNAVIYMEKAKLC